MKQRYVVLGVSLLTLLALGLAAGYAELSSAPGVVINEIMYNPPWNEQWHMSDEKYEWIELFNSSTAVIDMGGWTITTSVGYEYTIPSHTTIAAGGYLIVASDVRAFNGGLPDGWTVTCPVVGNTGYDTAILGNAGSTIILHSALGAKVDEVSYTDRSPWPASGLSAGRTLELTSPQADNSEASSWAASAISAPLGTPGRPNSVLTGSELWQGAVTVNPSTVNVLTRIPQQTFIIRNDDNRELQGVSLTLPTDWLWSGKAANVSVAGGIGEITVTGNGRAGKPYVITVSGLELASGAQLELTLARVTAAALADTANEFCLSATDGEQWYPMSNTPTVVVTATTQKANHIVINEIYNNDGDSVSANYCDWVELYNPTDEAVCVDGWYILDALPEQVLPEARPHEGALRIPNLTSGKDFVIQPGGYMLIVMDEQHYVREFPNGVAATVEGNLDFRSRNASGQRVDDPTKDGPAPNCERIGRFGLNKNRDELVLYDGENIVDAVAWGNGNSFNMLTSELLISRRGMSLSRTKDGYEAQEDGDELTELVGNSFNANARPTPGASNQ